MFETLGDHAEGKSLNSGDGFIAIRPVAHDAGKQRHFGEPTAVILALKFN